MKYNSSWLLDKQLFFITFVRYQIELCAHTWQLLWMQQLTRVQLYIAMNQTRRSVNMWTCKICGHRNPDGEDICEECGSYKDEPAYDAIDDEE